MNSAYAHNVLLDRNHLVHTNGMSNFEAEDDCLYL